MGEEHQLKPIVWVGSSKRDLMKMPEDIIDDFGFGLYQAQIGKFPDAGKVLAGFNGASVIELKREYKGDSFRAIYTVRFSEAVMILHVFQKKSKKGSTTPKQDKELITARLKMAEGIYKEWQNQKKLIKN